ncbi:MAG: DNA polymerase III subunit [Clostridia bacterium]|nr:DNA polymerase III subunit [Clostridia bacterium]
MYGYEILHEQIAENLINNIRSAIANQAYIFEGERGVGAKECARLFASALVCKNTSSAPCGVCNACIMAKAESHPDIYELMPVEGKRNISVDQIRSVVTDAYTKPYESEKKVYIIAYGDDMNEQAQNAFLKVLEEPPEYAVFVILAENNESLLPTIRSRCTAIRFNPVPDKKVEEYIRKNFPESAAKIDFLVQYAGGVVGDVEKILNTENFVPLRRESLDMLSCLLTDRKLDAYQVAEFMEENKEDADLVLRFWLGFLRDMLLIESGAEKLVKSTDFIDSLISLANKTREEKVVKATDEVLLAQQMRKRYVNLKAISLRLAFTIKSCR